MEKVLPAIVKVPGEISENKARSLMDAFKSKPPARRPKFLFFELISVRLAISSMEMLNSPVIAPASAVAVKSSEEEEEIATERALNRSSFCSAVAELFKVFRRLFRTPNSEILA